MKTIYVVRTTYVNEPGWDGAGGGGFLWFTDRPDAERYLATETAAWVGANARVTLTEVEVPATLTDDEITDRLDA